MAGLLLAVGRAEGSPVSLNCAGARSGRPQDAQTHVSLQSRPRSALSPSSSRKRQTSASSSRSAEDQGSKIGAMLRHIVEARVSGARRPHHTCRWLIKAVTPQMCGPIAGRTRSTGGSAMAPAPPAAPAAHHAARVDRMQVCDLQPHTANPGDPPSSAPSEPEGAHQAWEGASVKLPGRSRRLPKYVLQHSGSRSRTHGAPAISRLSPRPQASLLPLLVQGSRASGLKGYKE